MTSPPPPRVRPRDISDLLAWATSLSSAPHATDPTQWAAYLAAKADLLTRILTRIADQHTPDHPDHAHHAHRIASDAHTTAQRATTLLPTLAQETP
jgi:hypothetical protein